ncbi:FtsX-like permease family protein [Priestia taiwanensis]|uniref:Permease n=1 Tax=Priestia taiwanensis TaxID=1347902 RepID=A0A917ELJ6_9BACI|nr:FtsX-like permease family protein [Priestia taiwanensis]MBM7362204.1 putative ABC transport system permease protein [Priestia taiwanensis]GGE60230.1 permease [Priestia taiwanensis]
MRWIYKYAWKSIKQNWIRVLFVSLGTSLGVMLAVTLLLGNDIANKNVEKQVIQKYGDYHLQFGYTGNDTYMDENDIAQLEALQVAENMSKVFLPYPVANDKSLVGKPVYWGVEADSPDMQAFSLVTGRYPQSGAEVAITEDYIEREGIQVGDIITMPFPPYSEKEVMVVGVLDAPEMAAMGHSAYFPIQWLQEQVQKEGKVNVVQVKVSDTHQKRWLVDEISEKFPDVKIDQRIYMDKAFDKLHVMQPLVYSLGAIALFVVALLVMGSFYLSVRNRMKQWALLRAMGSKISHIMSIILIEACFIGAIGAFIGIVMGIGAQYIVTEQMNEWLGIEGGNHTFTIAWELLIIPFILGVTMAVIGAIIPAFIIRKIKPVQVMRLEISNTVLTSNKKNSFYLVLVVIGFVISFFGPTMENVLGFNPSIIGTTLFAIGILCLIPFFIQYLVPIIIRPFEKVIKIEAMISKRHVIQYRRKAAISVAILSLGFMLSITANMYVEGLYEGTKQGLQRNIPADIVVRVPIEVEHRESLPVEWKEKISNIEGVRELTAFTSTVPTKLTNYDFSKADAEWMAFYETRGMDYTEVKVVGTNMQQFIEMATISVVEGKELKEPLMNNEAVITKEMAMNVGLNINDTLSLAKENGEIEEAKVVSIIDKDIRREGSAVFMNEEYVQTTFEPVGYESLEVMLEDGASVEKIKDEMKRITKGHESAEIINSHELLVQQQQFLSQITLLIRSLVVIISIISAIGLMNAIVASIHDRRAEISMIRAIGGTSSQLVKVIVMEGILLGTCAGIIGVGGGLLFSTGVLNAMELHVVRIPVIEIVMLLGVSIALGGIAARIAALQLKSFSLHDTLKELSA